MNKAKDIAESTVKGVTKNFLSIIPIASTMIDVYEQYQALQTERKINRLRGWYKALNDDVQKLKENLNHNYIQKEDFLDIFEETARYVVNERKEEKRLLYKNILLNSAISTECSYDKTETYLRLLSQLDTLALEILKILSDPIQYNKDKGMIIADLPKFHSGPGIHYTLSYKFIEQLCQLLGDKDYEEDDVYEELYFLENNRIIEANVKDRSCQTNINPVIVLENCLTKKGKDFVSFLKE